MTTTVAINMTATGPIPTPPATLLAELIAGAVALDPGLTTNLPGSLIEDISSTQVAGLSVIDQASVDYINSLSPYTANAGLIVQWGNLTGVPQGQDTNTSVFVIISGPAGFVINAGFIVSDGTYQYILQDGGIIATDGQTSPLYALSNQQGTWAVPSATVTQPITSVPSSISLTVTNPLAGTPGTGAQSIPAYQADVVQAMTSGAQGMSAFLKTQLAKVTGVQSRLVSVRNPGAGEWQILVGGGDPYQVAYAIWTGLFDISTLVGSTIGITGITNANPGVVTTNLNHGLVTGQSNVHISGVVGPTGVNGGPYTVTVIDEKNFSFGVNTTSSGSYVSGGVVTPNSRNISVSINDYPDTYAIPLVIPPQQTTVIDLTWNTNSTNYVPPAAVAQLGNPAIVSYINSIAVGQPINLFEMQNAFQTAIASILPPTLLSRMIFVVTINGVVTNPTSGTGLIVGDPESYFFTSTANVVIAQG